MEKRKSLFIKILVPFLIIAAIGILWLVKNNSDKTVDNDLPQNVQSAADLPEHLQDADFSLEVTAEVDFAALAEYDIPVIVDYGSDSCIPSMQMAPALITLNEEMYGKAFVKFADVWVYTDAANNVPVQVIPTQVLFNADGTPFVPSDSLAKEIAFTMYNDRTSGDHVFTVHQGGLTEDQMRMILAEVGVE